MRAKLLWTNPNVQSAFNGQTLSVDLSKADYVEIVVNYHTSLQDEKHYIIPKNQADSVIGTRYGSISSGGDIDGRYVNCTDTSITFGNARTNVSDTNRQNYVIPARIYAITGKISGGV